jgi:hypothetical protein
VIQKWAWASDEALSDCFCASFYTVSLTTSVFRERPMRGVPSRLGQEVIIEGA